MGNIENVETTDLLDDIIQETKETLSPLKQDIEYRGLEGQIIQMYNFAKILDAQYQEILKKKPDLAQLQFTRVIAEGSAFSVYDAEYHSSYTLKLYGCYDLSKNELMDPGRLPELINFDEYGARTTHVLDLEQYKKDCQLIGDMLNREAEQISKWMKMLRNTL